MKLTKIESYEIQAFAFRVMTGYMAPGKDVSPLACEAPYEERCAAWEEWRNKHAHCILAMLHGFEALIDRNDEPTRALLDRLAEREAECERLRADLDDCINVLPNTAYYLDPPDGGSVPIAEQLRRMGEDAARYRWLRGGPHIPPGSSRWSRWEVRNWNGRHWNTLFADQVDAAIDAARSKE